MYFHKLGFFQEQAARKRQNKIEALNLLSANLKNNSLRNMLFAYLGQELNSLIKYHSSKKALVKQRRSLSKFTTRKRRERKRSTLKIHKVEAFAINPQKTRLSHRLR